METQAHGRYGRAIATWDDVARIALSLPATEPGTTFRAQAWKVASKPKPKAFAWVRPLNQSDVTALTPGARDPHRRDPRRADTEGMGEKEARPGVR